MIYYKLSSLKKMLIGFIKNNILADIFENYFEMCAMDLDSSSSIVRNIKLIILCDVKRKKL